MSDWKTQVRYFACHSIVDGQCTCGNRDCDSPGKHPCSKGWKQQATNDPKQVEKWRNDPKINLAIACGVASNLFVLDVDGIYGPISVAALEKENGPLPETFNVKTGNGSQLYFRYPTTPLPNSVKFVDDLDTRSEGGYVIAEGSRHKSGRTYTVIKDVPPAEMPEWLVRRILLGKRNGRKNGGGVAVPNGGLQKGSRNVTIFKLAASLHHKKFSIEAATAACLAENQNAAQSLPECEVTTAVKSAYGYPADDALPNFDFFSDGDLTTEFVASDPALKYATDEQIWFDYREGIWQPKEWPKFEIEAFLRSIEPTNIANPKLADAIHRRLTSLRAVASVRGLAEDRPQLKIKVQDFDPDLMLLGLPGGEVLDLRTGERRAATPYDLLTRALPVAPRGSCPRWLEYLKQAHPNDEELIAYLQRWAGYCLTARTVEDMILFLIGIGGSGKGTFVEPLQKLLGDYCVPIPIGMLLESTDEDRRLNYIAKLRGARLAICNEGSKMRRLDSRGIKMLTGGGWIAGRRLGYQPINFKATHKIVVLANDNPVLELDDAMRQRVHVVPFNQNFRGQEREEKGLREFFAEQEQLQGIFAWMLEGCLAYQREGLKPPASVTTTTEQYFKDADTFEQFLQDETEEARGLDVFLPTESGFRRYANWCERQGYTDKFTVGTTTTFASSLRQKRPHLKPGRASRGAGGRGFAGIRLRPQEELTFGELGEQL
jgi:P4 family phage/plasmid primase-like protien